MRAFMQLDAQHGPGYGVVEIYGANEAIEPVAIITRVSDGLILSQGGWGTDSYGITPEHWDINPPILRMWFGPAIMDDITPDGKYEIELPGIGKCALIIASEIQSKVIQDNGADTYPPPPEAVAKSPQQVSENEIIFEGVEKTPQVESDEVAGGTNEVNESGPLKPAGRKGCIAGFIGLLAIWIGGGWLLWQGAMNSAPDTREEISMPFEIIPKSDEKSFVEENTDEEKIEHTGKAND